MQLRSKEREQLLWAGAPIIRTRTILILFAIWSLLLIVPVCVLVELVDETGGWWALTWAVVSVFIFVPRVSQGSRVVFALTTLRAFVSVRTMYCSIETRTINYRHVGSVRVSARSDGTGEVVLRKKDDPYNVEEVRIYNVKGFRDACRVLQKALAPSIVERAGLSEMLSPPDDDGDGDCSGEGREASGDQ